MSTYCTERVAAVPMVGRHSLAGSANARAHRVVRIDEFVHDFARLCAETMSAHEAARLPGDVRGALANISRGDGLRSLATIYVAACDPALSVPLTNARRVAAFPLEYTDAQHWQLAPESWTSESLFEAHEDENEANHHFDRSQDRVLRDQSVSALVCAEETGRVQIAETERYLRVIRWMRVRKESIQYRRAGQ